RSLVVGSLSLVGSAALAILLGHDLVRDLELIRRLGEGRFALSWSPRSRDLAALLARQPSDAVATIDWGLMNPLLALGDGRQRLHELTFHLLEVPQGGERRRELADDLLCSEPGTLFVAHDDKHGFFAAAKQNFFVLARETGREVRLVGTVP